MTLQELKDNLSWLRENGANVNRTVCKAWILEYLSDKDEIPRCIFDEIKKYADIRYSETDNSKIDSEMHDKISDQLLIFFEANDDNSSYFGYRFNRSMKRNIKVLD